MKILALDIGDKWVGSALSDELGITCKPYKTVLLDELENFLEKTISDEPVEKVIVGHPVTVSGRVSAQTKTVEEIFLKLKKLFSKVGDKSITWILWDERFSTKRALEVLKGRDKKKEHSIAAAFILQTYLDAI
jgi:putative Holliday junction resolvase